jgi:hypothetical protein
MHLYDRSVHPELFTVYRQTAVSQDMYSAHIKICDAGHLVEFQHKHRPITEVIAFHKQDLPHKKRTLERRLRGCRDESFRFDCGVTYQVSYQLEKLDPDVFLNFHEELLVDCERAAVAHRFPAGTRLSPCPLSLIRADACRRSLLIHAFHTFPESCAVVKTQSLFEI